MHENEPHTSSFGNFNFFHFKIIALSDTANWKQHDHAKQVNKDAKKNVNLGVSFLMRLGVNHPKRI